MLAIHGISKISQKIAKHSTLWAKMLQCFVLVTNGHVVKSNFSKMETLNARNNNVVSFFLVYNSKIVHIKTL